MTKIEKMIVDELNKAYENNPSNVVTFSSLKVGDKVKIFKTK